MGKIEEKSYQKRRRKNLQKIILQTIGLAGVLSVALIAPNTLQAFAKLGLIKTQRQKEIISNSRNRLIRAGFLYKDKNNFVSLTKKGTVRLRLLEHKDYKIKKPKRWDGKWRVLIFDIPEKRKNTREKVRLTLAALGFKHLQDSVWVFPYDCEDLITLLKADFRIGKDLLYMIVDSIENDYILRNYFNLP